MNQINMINRFYEKMPKSDIKKKYPEFLFKKNNKKIIIINFSKICNELNRDIEDIKNYIEKLIFGNLNNGKITLSSDGMMILHDNISITTIKNSISSYIDLFSKCGNCENIITEIYKEDRINYIYCNNCKSKKPIKN